MFVLALGLNSCSEEDVVNEVSNSQLKKSNNLETIVDFNNAVHQISESNNIDNDIDFVDRFILNDYSFLTELPELGNYNFIEFETLKIERFNQDIGYFHVASIDENQMIVYHENETGQLTSLIKIMANHIGNDLYETQITDLLNLNKDGMTREECEQQTEDGLKVVAIFAGATSWWCPPCAAASGITGAMLAAGNFSCRYMYD